MSREYDPPDETRKEKQHRKDEKTRNRQVYFMVTALVSFAALVAVCIWYTNYSIGKNNEIWCDFLAPYNIRVDSVPHPTQEQRETAVQFHHLQDRLDC